MAFYLPSFQRAFSNISIISLLIILPALCKADPWLPEPGQYKISSSFSMVDKESRNRKKIREGVYLESQIMMNELGEIKAKLLKRLLLEGRVATNNERRTLEQIDSDMRALDLVSSEQKAYRDDKISNMMIEYGINEKYSFGVKIGYILNKFSSYSIKYRDYKFVAGSKNNSFTSTNNVDVFLKYKIFDNDNWVITIQPKLCIDGYGNSGHKLSQEVKLMVGYSREATSNATMFSEIGIFAGNNISNKWGEENSAGISFSEGIKFQNGVIFSNFFQYSTKKLGDRIYDNSLYEQISVAKEIGFGRLKQNNFTISAGYFFDQSLVDRSFRLSGPIFSLWFNI